MPDRQTSEKLFKEHLGWIDRVADMTCRQHGMWDAEAEDFGGWIRMRLMENDFAPIRNYRGESGIRTYLATVVWRQFQDYRRQRWGRWRASAAAQRLGPPAPELETLVHRDGYSLRQAAEHLRTRGRTTLSDADLARLLNQLPTRAPLRLVEVSSEPALAAAEGDARADERVTAAEVEAEQHRVLDALKRALAKLDPEERMLVRMHFQDGDSVADVARALNLDQKPLYRRLERLRLRLREYVEAEGVQSSDVLGILGEQEDL